ncbi:hypothetical protein EOPP23_18945 [Endozoicomonas sp. OPT23]|uniref:hypothetical protein n=1 Tax=Endozoicomonas sp. OPT23 TaxID=2072845 RepID=UPI00129A10BB|nr:hypothetical protein [Endozoicomonas sp. OPT23]MRI35050.1 hypothetical protein [Endozoicomonas sp. OPT23]
MESIILLIICLLALYQLSVRQNKIANQLIANTYSRFERRYNKVTYSCPDSEVVLKELRAIPGIPMIPSLSYTAKALCMTEQKEWFWFEANIRFMRVQSTNIVPAEQEEARAALQGEQSLILKYFPEDKAGKQSSRAKPETTSH